MNSPLDSAIGLGLPNLVQEGRRQEAEGRRQESLYSKLFNLFQLDSYFCHAALAKMPGCLNNLSRK
jgi:hypothetical protein